MDFLELAKERYSCKKFSDKDITNEQLEKILEVGRLAPTAKNLQEQKIYVIKSQEGLAKIDKLTPCRYGAPTVILVAFNKKRNVEKIYYCAEFVKDVLKKSDIDISGLPEVIQPEHFKGLKNTKLIYKGLFKEYKKKNNYMEQLLEFMLSKKRASSH